MFLSKKIRLIPTKEQEVLFKKSAGVARWAYNYFLAEQEKHYAEYIANGKQGKSFLNEGEVRKYINNVLKPTTHSWLKEVGSNVMKMAIIDADRAYKNYFKDLAKKPRYKTKHKSTLSFYVNYESLVKKPNGFHGEKIGYVKTSEPLPKIPKDKKYSNPRISFDGKYWYLSVGYEVEEIQEELTRESLGIDLGVKELAICSDGVVYPNINNTKEVKRLKKKLKREKRKLSRMLEANIKEYKTVDKKRYPVWLKPLRECKNYQKQKQVVRLIYRRLSNIRNNYLHQTTTEIVKTKPSQIVMETLNIQGMMKNKHLAEKIAEQKLFEFKRQIKYKSELRGIKVTEVDQWFPSSKLCSRCGSLKKDLKLSDRIYKCNTCGYEIDRDFNASINLANYKVA